MPVDYNAVNYNEWIMQLRVHGVRIATAIVIFILFWIGSRIAFRLVQRLSRSSLLNPDLLNLFGQTARTALLVLGAVTALGTAGVNVSALVAGLGLTGFALGFAFRDILSNLLAGVLLLMYKPFRRGDHISVTGLEGAVTEIDLRYTVLTHQGKTILIPNQNLFTNPIIVNDPNPAAAPAPAAPPGPKIA